MSGLTFKLICYLCAPVDLFCNFLERINLNGNDGSLIANYNYMMISFQVNKFKYSIIYRYKIE